MSDLVSQLCRERVRSRREDDEEEKALAKRIYTESELEVFEHTMGIALPDAGWKSKYFDRLLFRGAMRIPDTTRILYDSPPRSVIERGNVWCDKRVTEHKGIYPLVSRSRKRISIDRYLSFGGAWGIR